MELYDIDDTTKCSGARPGDNLARVLRLSVKGQAPLFQRRVNGNPGRKYPRMFATSRVARRHPPLEDALLIDVLRWSVPLSLGKANSERVAKDVTEGIYKAVYDMLEQELGPLCDGFHLSDLIQLHTASGSSAKRGMENLQDWHADENRPHQQVEGARQSSGCPGVKSRYSLIVNMSNGPMYLDVIPGSHGPVWSSHLSRHAKDGAMPEASTRADGTEVVTLKGLEAEAKRVIVHGFGSFVIFDWHLWHRGTSSGPRCYMHAGTCVEPGGDAGDWDILPRDTPPPPPQEGVSHKTQQEEWEEFVVDLFAMDAAAAAAAASGAAASGAAASGVTAAAAAAAAAAADDAAGDDAAGDDAAGAGA